MHGPAPGGGARGAACHRSVRQVAVTDVDRHVLHRRLQHAGGDLGEYGPRAGTDVGGVHGDAVRAVGGRVCRCVGGPGVDGVRGGGDARTEQQGAFPADSRTRVAVVPAETFRTVAEARGQIAAAEGLGGVRLGGRIVAQPQCDGVGPESRGQFVDG